MDCLASWNGVVMPLSEVSISPLDRAYLFGDAVYEVMRIYQGRIYLEERHWQRLRQSLVAMQIPENVSRTQQRLEQLLQRAECSEGYIYLQISRGVAVRQHAFDDLQLEPTELLYVQPIEQDPYATVRAQGVRVASSKDLRWQFCHIKTTNLLANCLALTEAKRQGCVETLLIDRENRCTEGSHSSFFAIIDGQLRTAPLTNNILPGVTRARVLELALQLQIPVVEEAVSTAELAALEEAFLTGTVTEILAVQRIDDRLVGDGRPGAWTQKLYRALRADIDQYCTSAAKK